MDNFDRRVRYTAQRYGLSREAGSGAMSGQSAAEEHVTVLSLLGITDEGLTPAQRRRVHKKPRRSGGPAGWMVADGIALAERREALAITREAAYARKRAERDARTGRKQSVTHGIVDPAAAHTPVRASAARRADPEYQRTPADDRMIKRAVLKRVYRRLRRSGLLGGVSFG